MIRHDPFFFVLVSQKSGLCALQVCNITHDSIGYGLAFKKQAGGTAKYEAAFRSLNFQKNPISKKPIFKKTGFKKLLWFYARHVEGNRLSMGDFHFRQETL